MNSTMGRQGYFVRAARPVRRLGFSIPEMLAVVAIIVIIISILLPNLSQGREVAREAVCRSNMHSLGVASRNYSTETRYLPTGWNFADGSIVWIRQVWDYIGKDPDWFNCPSAPRQAVWAGIKKGSSLIAGGAYLAGEFRVSMHENFSYGHNNDGSQAGLNVGVGEGWQAPSIMAARVAAPSNFIMYGDTTVDGLWDHFIDEDYEDGAGRTEYPADRHRGGSHLVFGDGHVEWDLQKYLIHLGSEGTALPEMRRRWNNDNQPH